MSNLQEITTDIDMWDYIAKALIKQGEKSVNLIEDEDGSHYLSDICMYRAFDENGNVFKCAVGWVIDDIYYDDSIEEKPVRDNAVLAVVKKSIPNFKIDPPQLTMFELAQKIHDNVKPNLWNFAFSVCREICFTYDNFSGPGDEQYDYPQKMYTLIRSSYDNVVNGFAHNPFPEYILDEE